MSETWTVTFQLTRKIAWEGMIAAGRVYQTGWSFVWSIAHTVLLCLFAPVGLCMAGFVLWRRVAGHLPDLSFWAFPPLMMVVALGCLWVSFAPWKRLARAVEEARFTRSGRAEISANGFTLHAPHSEWRTGWADVETVLGTKKTLIVLVSSIALIVPRDAFADAEEAEQALAAMQRWQADAMREGT